MFGAHIRTDRWHCSPASFSATAAAEGLRAVSSRTLDDTVRVSGVRLLSTCEIMDRKPVSAAFWKGEIFSFSGNFLLSRLRPIKYNSSACCSRRFKPYTYM